MTRIIQIGVGGFGNTWLRTIAADQDVEMVALVDLNEAALKVACEEHGWDPAMGHGDLTKALAAVDADLAVVVTPPQYHRQPVIQCLEAGLDVISEKPMAEDPADCRAMMAAAERQGRRYVVSQNYRYTPDMKTLARLIAEGRIGKIGQVKIDFYLGHNFGGGFRHEMDYPVLVDMSIHHFDLIRFVTGLNATSVRGESWNPAWSNYRGDCSSTLTFTMENEARVLYNASWCAMGQYCNWNGNWQIEGERGTLLYEQRKITLIPVETGYQTGQAVAIPLDEMERTNQAWVLHHVCRCRETGETPQTLCSDNIHSIGMVFAAVEAVKTEERVAIEG
jgi:predicted dehydrogenase